MIKYMQHPKVQELGKINSLALYPSNLKTMWEKKKTLDNNEF